MALAAAEAGAVAVDRDQRHQDHVGFDHGGATLGLENSERTAVDRIAGFKQRFASTQPAERLALGAHQRDDFIGHAVQEGQFARNFSP